MLPEGLYLGRVEADDVVGLVEALAQGRLPAEHLRGRSSLPLPTQAAQQFARERARPLGTRRPRAGGAGARRPGPLAGPSGGRPGVDVVVRYDRDRRRRGARAHLRAAEAKVAAVFRLVGLEVLAPA